MTKRTTTREHRGSGGSDPAPLSKPAPKDVTRVDAPALPDVEAGGTAPNPLPQATVPEAPRPARRPTRELRAEPKPDSDTSPSVEVPAGTLLNPVPELPEAPQPPRPQRKPSRTQVPAAVQRSEITAPSTVLTPALEVPTPPVRPQRKPSRTQVPAAAPRDATALTPAVEPEPEAPVLPTALIQVDPRALEKPRRAHGDHTAELDLGKVQVPRRPEPDPPWKVALQQARDRWTGLPEDLRLKVLVGSGVGLFMIVVFIWAASALTSGSGSALRPVGPSDDDDQLLASGRAAIADRRWTDAEIQLEQAHRARPRSELVSQQLARAQADSVAATLLEHAKRAQAEERFTDARDDLDRVPKDTDLEAERKLAATELDDAESKSLFERAQSLLKTGHPGQAAALEIRLAKLRPELAQVLEPQLKSATEAAAAQAAPRPTARRTGDEPEIRDALDLFDRDPSAGADQLDRLASSHKPRVAQQAKALAPAARKCAQLADRARSRELSDLDRADAACGTVNPGGVVALRLSNQRLEAATKLAASAMANENWANAAHAYRSILAVKPGDAGARTALQKLLDRAHELYMQGYVAAPRDPENAKVVLSEALQILAPGDADYDKAREKLREVKGGAE